MTLITSSRSWVLRSRSQMPFSEMHFSGGGIPITIYIVIVTTTAMFFYYGTTESRVVSVLEIVINFFSEICLTIS